MRTNAAVLLLVFVLSEVDARLEEIANSAVTFDRFGSLLDAEDTPNK